MSGNKLKFDGVRHGRRSWPIAPYNGASVAQPLSHQAKIRARRAKILQAIREKH